MRTHALKPAWQMDIARERIQILFRLAEQEFARHPARAHRYVQLAQTIAKRYTVRLDRAQRRKLCRACRHFLQPGANARVRARPLQQAIVVTCLDCGSLKRLPYRREQAEKR